MRCMTSPFGCGWVFGGFHQEIKPHSSKFSALSAVMRVAKIEVIPDEYTVSFWEAENMGVLPPPKCERCTQCHKSGPCSDRNRLLNEKQNAELDVISANTKLVNGEIWCD